MSRQFINAVKNFRQENSVVKFDVGEESISDRGLNFQLVAQFCLARDEFCGLASYLQDQALQLKKEVVTHDSNLTPVQQDFVEDSEIDRLDSPDPCVRIKLN